MIVDILSWLIIAAIWLMAPGIIANEKGRRWWVWCIISVLFPFLGLLIILSIHPSKKDGHKYLS